MLITTSLTLYTGLHYYYNNGKKIIIKNEELKLSYRKSNISDNDILVSAALNVEFGDKKEIEEELKIINKYGAWMEALADRKIEPITPEQKRFVDVSVGIAEPKSEYEKIWRKIPQARNDRFYLKYKKK